VAGDTRELVKLEMEQNKCRFRWLFWWFSGGWWANHLPSSAMNFRFSGGYWWMVG
jgi:hypothetical protein